MPPDTARPHWMPALDPAGAPLYLQIAGALEAAVADGALRPGDRLPPQRLLAGALGVDLTTITRAYDEARRRKLLDAVTGRGSFVAARGTHPDETIDLGMNIPPAPRGLSLAELIGRDVASLLRGTDADRLMTYHVGPGNEVDRAAGALWLEPLLGKLPVGRIVIAPGAQAALAAVLSLRAKAGDTILAERLTYPGLLSAAAHLGVRVVGIETDGEGPLPQALEAACRLHAPRLVYLLPTIHNPTSVTTPEPRRRDIVRIAARMRLPILEDDPYSLLAGQTSGRGPPPAFATLLPQQTTYIATVSKTLTPGLQASLCRAAGGRGRRGAGRRAEGARSDAGAADDGVADPLDPRGHGGADPGGGAHRGGAAPAAGGRTIAGHGQRAPLWLACVAALAAALGPSPADRGGAAPRARRHPVGCLRGGFAGAGRGAHLARRRARPHPAARRTGDARRHHP